MMLPGFERSIELFRDLTPETARVMVKTAEVADKTAYAGMLLVDSYVNYVQQHAGHADRETLAGLKAQLLDLVDQIDNLDVTADALEEEPVALAEEEAAEPVPVVTEQEADVPEIAACGNEEEFTQAPESPVRSKVAEKMGFDFDIGSALTQ